jgi:hypothetical protein
VCETMRHCHIRVTRSVKALSSQLGQKGNDTITVFRTSFGNIIKSPKPGVWESQPLLSSVCRGSLWVSSSVILRSPLSLCLGLFLFWTYLEGSNFFLVCLRGKKQQRNNSLFLFLHQEMKSAQIRRAGWTRARPCPVRS